jgi:hypothetical protein
MRRLLIDDFRDENFFPNVEFTAVCKTFESGLLYLEKHGPWDELWLDHDLGDPSDKKSGYAICVWLERHPQYLPKVIQVITANPVGRRRMNIVLARLYTRFNLYTGRYWL